MTTDTTTLPALAEAMTARSLIECERYVAKMLGTPNAYCAIGHTESIEGPAYIRICPKGITRDEGSFHAYGKSYPDVLRKGLTWIANRPKVERNATIRRLALAIIEITDERTKCTVAMLRAKGFDDDQIALHAEACVRAGEMANCAPFFVEGAP